MSPLSFSPRCDDETNINIKVERMQEITRLSFSTVNDYADCGEKVRLKKIEQVTPTPSLAMAGGRAVHEVTANLDLLDFSVPVEGPLSFEDAFEAELSELEESAGLDRSEFRVSGKASTAYPNKEDLGWWKDHGQTFVGNWRRFLKGSPYQIALTPHNEPAVEIELNGSIGDAPVKGYIDRVLEDPQGHLFIVDLKTGMRKPKPKQIMVYRLLLAQVFEGEWVPRYGFYYMNRSGLMTSPQDLDSLDDGSIEYEYRMAWTGMRAGVFIPNTNTGWCSSCDVAKYCYAMNGEDSGGYLPFSR